MAVHGPVWNASSIAMWEWERRGFSGLCVACGLRARTPLLEADQPAPQTLLCPALSRAAWPFPSSRSGQGRDFGHQSSLSVCSACILINVYNTETDALLSRVRVKNVAVSEQVFSLFFLAQRMMAQRSDVIQIQILMIHGIRNNLSYIEKVQNYKRLLSLIQEIVHRFF